MVGWTADRNVRPLAPAGRSAALLSSPLADIFLVSGAGFANPLSHMTIAARDIPGGSLLPGRFRGLTMGQKLLHYDVIERLGDGARSVISAVSEPVTKQ